MNKNRLAINSQAVFCAVYNEMMWLHSVFTTVATALRMA